MRQPRDGAPGARVLLAGYAVRESSRAVPVRHAACRSYAAEHGAFRERGDAGREATDFEGRTRLRTHHGDPVVLNSATPGAPPRLRRTPTAVTLPVNHLIWTIRPSVEEGFPQGRCHVDRCVQGEVADAGRTLRLAAH